MNISENEAHSAIYCSENEYFARRCRHYKAKESKAESVSVPYHCDLMRKDIIVGSVKYFSQNGLQGLA